MDFLFCSQATRVVTKVTHRDFLTTIVVESSKRIKLRVRFSVDLKLPKVNSSTLQFATSFLKVRVRGNCSVLRTNWNGGGNSSLGKWNGQIL